MLYFKFLFLTICAYLLHALPAFPGAEGWGAQATGGRGGKVLIVDNLNDAGPGSFRAAICDTGKRIIVFRVSGVINLTTKPTNSFSRIFLTTKNSNFTLAGQTSPGGITLVADGRLLGSLAPEFSSTGPKNFVFRFIRARCTRPAGLPCTYETTDAAQFSDVDNFIFDHCDFSGGDDGTFDITRGSNFTIQWCTITNSTYRCDDHGGSLMAYTPSHHISLHHNLWAHHQVRGPLFHWGEGNPTAPEFGMIEYSNNVSYNMWDFTFMIQNGGEVHYNLEGNTFVEGPNKHYYNDWVPEYCSHRYSNDVQVQSSAIGFVADNRHLQEDGAVLSFDPAKSSLKTASTRHTMTSLITTSASSAYEAVIKGAGLWYQDSMNRRLEDEIRTRTGTHRNNQATFVTEGPAAPTDADLDGMPDFWEDAMGLNKSDAGDAAADKDGDGYTNIEEYINDLALARLGKAYDNPVDPIPAEWKSNPLRKIKISRPAVELVQNDTTPLSVVKKYAYFDSLEQATAGELSWSLSPSGFGTVDAQGILRATQPVDSGKVIGWLTSNPAIRDTFVVTVRSPLAYFDLIPTDDAMADWYNRAVNNGSRGTLVVKSTQTRTQDKQGFDLQRPYFQFDLSGIPKGKPILKAELSLCVINKGFDTVSFPMSVFNTVNSWDETTLTWANCGSGFKLSTDCDASCPGDVAHLFVKPSLGRQSWDLTSYVQTKAGKDTLSFFLYKYRVSNMSVTFASKDTLSSLQPRLRVVVGGITATEQAQFETEESIGLSVYPNPLNPTTLVSIRGFSPTAKDLALKVYNLQGMLIKDLTREILWEGENTGKVFWSPSNCGSGVYLIKIQSNTKALQQKAIFLK